MTTTLHTTLTSVTANAATAWCVRGLSAQGYAMEAQAGSSRTSIRFENQPKDPAEAAVK